MFRVRITQLSSSTVCTGTTCTSEVSESSDFLWIFEVDSQPEEEDDTKINVQKLKIMSLVEISVK